MKFKSAILTQVSGSIGGMTGSRNGGGMYFRARAMPTNPNTSFQQTVRENFGALSNAWALLTPEQRDGWYVYAANVQLPDRLGDQRNVSGPNMFMRSNSPRLSAGLTIIEDAPTIFNIGPTPILTITEVTDNGTWTATADVGSPGVAGNVLVYLSRPQQDTVRFFRGPYQFIEVGSFVSPGSAPVSIGPTSPFTLTAGQRAFIQVRTSLADGRLSAPGQASEIVTAFA